MWQRSLTTPPYEMREIELTRPLEPFALGAGMRGAHVLLRHRGRPAGRLWVDRARHGDTVSVETLTPRIAKAARLWSAIDVFDDLAAGHAEPAPTPSLTIAVCTRGRPLLVRRCLSALLDMVARRPGAAGRILIRVVDNAPPDGETAAVAREFANVRYVVEPVPGLDFARNRAIAETGTDYLAFIDDDAVVDHGWLDAVANAVRASPGAGGFTGPVLPLCLETEAQLRFERAGGFGEGIAWTIYDRRRWDDPVYPAGAGRIGTGANMVFATAALDAIGGFDEALDTGPPLPGGGDIDAFYRLVRAGWRIVYSPGQTVHHEHRRDMAGLRRQYHSWGVSVATLVAKNRRTDPQTRAAGRRILVWFGRRHLRDLARALTGRGPRPPGFVAAEALGGVRGFFGEYQRSQRRVAERKRAHASR